MKKQVSYLGLDDAFPPKFDLETKFFLLDIHLFDDEEIYRHAWQKVSEGRRQKAAALKMETDRKRSIGAEWLLLKSLAEMGIETSSLSFSYGEKGKPYLADQKGIYFNLSHSGDKIMCVISPCEVGCDIEQMKKRPINVAKHFFCEKEYELIQKQGSEREKMNLFFRFWTLKESFIKATGMGMAQPLNSFEILFEENQVFVKQSLDSRNWYLKEVDIVDGYKAAVCGLDPEISNLKCCI